MSKQTFQHSPDLGAKRLIKPRVGQIKFGDGYELRLRHGINTSPRQWSVVFTRGAGEAMEILSFLEARNAAESFLWTDPLNKVGTFVCREWSSAQVKFGIYKVDAVFEEVFE